ncbi:MAG: cell division protein FtsZ [Thermodesulfobacteriota bacterium]|nr:cell division protein FtsZ [Thermodesulfobacteriota bacterium]
MEIEFIDSQKPAKIKVVGIGGAGNNAINNMIASGLAGVGFVAANTDLQDLENSNAPVKLQLGAERTKGLGCGANPEIGREAAEEDTDKIQEVLSDCDMIFITAGMGGGTGTGGAPVVAKALKELDPSPLVVGVVTKPFGFEGPRRMRQAEAGIECLKEHADTIITIPNNRLLAMAPRSSNIQNTFKLADDILLHAVKGISDLILLPGLINLDFKDVWAVMSKKGQALMGTGVASGPDRATVAAQAAISNPLLEDISHEGAQGILINITGAQEDLTLDEVNDASTMIQKEADPEAEVIIGVAWDNSLNEELRITVIATGIGEKGKKLPVNPDETTQVASLDEVARKQEYFDLPTRERTGPRNLNEYEPPQYSAKYGNGNKYENFKFHEEEDLETPTFMRRKGS